MDLRRDLSMSASVLSSHASNSPHSTPSSKKKVKVEIELTPEELAKKERKNQKKDELTREHDKIINEIEQSDQTCMGAALKTVYTLGHVGRFQKKLEKRIRNQEREIERMCGFHYSHFVEAIEELSGIQGDAYKLVKQVSDTNQDLQLLGGEISSRHIELIRIRRQQDNINKVILGLSSTLPILIAYKKLKLQMTKGKYYSALKTLQQIQHSHLPQVRQYKFAEHIENAFPTIRSEVLMTSSNELKDFLENVQINAPKVGTVILQKYCMKRLPTSNSPSSPLPGSNKDTPIGSPISNGSAFNSSPRKMSKFRDSKRSLTESAIDESNGGHSMERKLKIQELDDSNPFAEDDEGVNPFGEDDAPEADRSDFSTRRESLTEKSGNNPFSDDATDAEDDMMSHAESMRDERYQYNLDKDVSDFVDFTPIHKSLHIHSLLGGVGDFVQGYRAEREHQARLLFTPPKDIRQFSNVYRRFLHQILGFFAIEDVLLHSTTSGAKHQLVEKLWLNRLLQSAVSRVLMLLRAQLAYSDDCQELLDSKELTVAFSDALAAYGFGTGVADLNAVLPEMWRQYVEGLLKSYGDQFTSSVGQDDLKPFIISSSFEEEQFKTFRYGRRMVKKMGDQYPKELPFSKSVFGIHELLQKFINSAHSYCIDVELEDVCVDVALARSVETLLQRNLRAALERTILDAENTLTLEEILQFVTNLSHMEKSVKDIEIYIKELDLGDRKTSGKNKARRRMRDLGTQLFQDMRRQAENGINPKINDKLDAKLKHPFDWAMKEAKGTTSAYLRETFDFLDVTFANLRELKMSDQLISDAIFATYQHIGFSMLEKLIDERIVCINMGALHQLSLDVLFCMGQCTAVSAYITANMKETLEGILGETWQLVDLFVEWDWETYFTERGQENAKYELVNPGIALKVMEKLRQDKKGKNILASLNINKRKKQKMQDTVIKQLRGLIKDWSLLTVPHRRLSQDQQDFFRDS